MRAICVFKEALAQSIMNSYHELFGCSKPEMFMGLILWLFKQKMFSNQSKCALLNCVTLPSARMDPISSKDKYEMSTEKLN